MRLLSIGAQIEHHRHTVVSVLETELPRHPGVSDYDYLIINGGDGTIRRVVKILHALEGEIPPLILNPTGSFNVIAKLHRVPPVGEILSKLDQKDMLKLRPQRYYALNEEIFLFSAGNMGDLQHIFLSETLRFGWLKQGMAKYMLALVLLLPAHILLTPFMLMSQEKFFIFTPLSRLKKLGSFRGLLNTPLEIDLGNNFNHIELDGDILTIRERYLDIRPLGEITIVTL